MRKDYSIDWLIILVYLFLVIGGWFTIYSTSAAEGADLLDWSTYHGKQLLFIGASVTVGLIILALDTKFTEFLSYAAYGAVMLLLLGTLILARDVKGASSWLHFGGFSLQGSEFAKVATLMALSKFMSRFNFSTNKLSDVLIASGIVLFPAAIILLQNDAGSALVFFSLIFVFFREGLSILIIIPLILVAIVGVVSLLLASVAYSWLWIIGFLLVAAIISLILLKGRFWAIHIGALVFFSAVALVPSQVLKDYQRLRIEVLVASEEEIREDRDLQKVAYNLRESLVAIGSGGLTGKGYGNATHTRGDFVPEEHTDYIFCVVGEEHGWVGSTLVIVVFFLLIWRLIYMAENSKSKYARIYGYGAASFFFFHILINIGMTIGLFPTIGIPLPFFSYGGSSMLGFSIIVFLMVNHYAYRVNILGGQQ